MAHSGFGKGGSTTGGLGSKSPATLSKKDTQVPSSGLNAPLLALFADLRYSSSIFACRLVVTENISGDGGQLPSFPPWLRPWLYLSFSGVPRNFKRG